MLGSRCIVYALDISISMGKSYGDLTPSKLASSVEAIAVASKRVLDSGGSIGIVLFAGKAFPVLALTNDASLVYFTLSHVGKKTFEASAPGDAIVEAVKLFVGKERECGVMSVVVLSDGEYNTGVPLDAALLFAKNTGVAIHYLVLGGQGQDKISMLLPRLNEIIDINYKKILSKQELFAEVTKIARGEQ